jgi:hypothetical protein
VKAAQALLARQLLRGKIMKNTCRNWGTRLSLTGFTLVAMLATPALARADGEVTMEGLHEPTAYPFEIEPHLTFGADNVYGARGFGAGLRVGIPVAVGHLGRLPQNLAVSFGGDILQYDSCYYGNYCSATYLAVPVALQWNVAVARPVSLFLEGGAFVYKGWFNHCGAGDVNCDAPPDFGVLPTVAIGGRVHLGENVALTLRVGYPTTTLGVSFL